MKHVYTKISGKCYSSASPLEKTARVMTAIMQGFMAPPKNIEDYYMEDTDFGLCFVPENNDFEHCAQITKRDVLDKYITNNNERDSYFEAFFGKMKNPDPGFVDNWNNKLYDDENVHIYYTLMNDGPHEFILTLRKDGFKVSPLMKKDKNGNVTDTYLLYMINIDGEIYDCTPDEGDYIFDTRKEAEDYYQTYLEEQKAKYEECLKQEEERKKLEEFKSKVESLGDGTYIGQMAGCKFYYQGNEYISPVGIRTSHPQNVVLDIKDGKVSIRDWGTPYDKWLEK